MSLFSYKVKNRKTGKTQKGVIDASSDKQAEKTLLEKDLIILSIEARDKPTSLTLPMNYFSGVSGEEVTMFTRQLSVMIAATVPLVKALKILVKQQEKIAFKVVLSDVAEEVDGGAKLSVAMAKYPKIFNNFYVYMIRSGETTGKLEQVLNYLADQKEKNMHIAKKIKNAMIYPAFIIVGLIGIQILVDLMLYLMFLCLVQIILIVKSLLQMLVLVLLDRIFIIVS